MGTRFLGLFTRRARPIFSERDYDRARVRLAEARAQPGWIRKDDRVDALAVAVAQFERRYVSREVQLAVEWAECVFVPQVSTDPAPRRRWNDPA